MAEHEHHYHEATDDPVACPDDTCWWNEAENHVGPGRYTELTIADDGPEFPENFTGAGPMFAAVPLGEPWRTVAGEGHTTYVQLNPYVTPLPTEEAKQAHREYAGWSAFLDRHQAEQVADHPHRSGEFYRWEGLTGVPDCTARRDAEIEGETDWDGAYVESEAGS